MHVVSMELEIIKLVSTVFQSNDVIGGKVPMTFMSSAAAGLAGAVYCIYTEIDLFVLGTVFPQG